jgi:hypothetical protein
MLLHLSTFASAFQPHLNRSLSSSTKIIWNSEKGSYISKLRLKYLVLPSLSGGKGMNRDRRGAIFCTRFAFFREVPSNTYFSASLF